jgi:hypothetical protein
LLAGTVAIVTVLITTPAAQGQKIVCWKDKAGKVIGCGDRIPPEYQDNESKRLDSRGITRETNVSAEEAARRRDEEKKQAAQRAEEEQLRAEQRRQDTALLNTYVTPKEIDARRDREVQVIELQIQQLKAVQKSSADAYAAQQKRYASFEKTGKPVPANVQDDLKRAAEENETVQARIADKEKDKLRISESYAQQKARFIELKGLRSTTTPPAPKPAPKN